METRTVAIRRQLGRDGWYLVRRGSAHDVYRHPDIGGIVTLPRHAKLSPAVVRSIARKAGWRKPGPGSQTTPGLRPEALDSGREAADLTMARYPALYRWREGRLRRHVSGPAGHRRHGRASVDEVLVNAEEALRDHVIEAEKAGDAVTPPTPMERVATPAGCTLVSVPFIPVSGRRVRASLPLDEGVAAFIDGEARRRNMTRTAFVEWMARRIAQEGG